MKRSYSIQISAFTIIFCLLLFACTDKKKKADFPFQSQKEYEESIIESHKVYLQKEKKRIEEFIEKSELSFYETGTGLRIHKYEQTEGDSLKSGDAVMISYLLKTLDGDTLYSIPKGAVQEFFVDFDNVESGLHEGIKQMRVGEKAVLILPAHLAHGISGDQAAIGYQQTIVYDLHLIGKR